MEYPLLERFRDSIEAMKHRLIAEHPDRFRGYKLSSGKGRKMTAMRTQAQWAKIEQDERRREAVVKRARAMIEWSHTEYEKEKEKNKHNLKIFSLLTLNWSPQRVLSRHKDFRKLCTALKDEKTWRMLTRKERAFVADAIGK
jgi:hypothetical protein